MPPHPVKIAPSILAADFARLGEQVIFGCNQGIQTAMRRLREVLQ